MTTARNLLTIDPADASPPFEQIRRQLTLLVETGELVPDERLPSVRQLAADLGVSNGTVARAYRELEAAEVVTTKQGGGTRVAPRATSASASELEAAAQDYLARAKSLGAGPDRAIQVLEIISKRP